MPALLVPQDCETGCAFLHVLCHNAKLEAVIERGEDLLFFIPEVRQLIGGRKERDHGDIHGHALIRIPVLVERREQGVQQPIRRL